MARQHVCIPVPSGIAMGIGTPLAYPTHGNFAIVSLVVDPASRVRAGHLNFLLFAVSGLPVKLRMSYWLRMGRRIHRHDYRLMNSGSAVAGLSNVTGRGAGSSGSQP